MILSWLVLSCLIFVTFRFSYIKVLYTHISDWYYWSMWMFQLFSWKCQGVNVEKHLSVFFYFLKYVVAWDHHATRIYVHLVVWLIDKKFHSEEVWKTKLCFTASMLIFRDSWPWDKLINFMNGWKCSEFIKNLVKIFKMCSKYKHKDHVSSAVDLLRIDLVCSNLEF